MRRVTIQAAFLGEGGDSDTGDEEGLALAVRGGEIVLVLPAGTPEARSVDAASTPRGALRLRTGPACSPAGFMRGGSAHSSKTNRVSCSIGAKAPRPMDSRA